MVCLFRQNTTAKKSFVADKPATSLKCKKLKHKKNSIVIPFADNVTLLHI